MLLAEPMSFNVQVEIKQFCILFLQESTDTTCDSTLEALLHMRLTKEVPLAAKLLTERNLVALRELYSSDASMVNQI